MLGAPFRCGNGPLSGSETEVEEMHLHLVLCRPLADIVHSACERSIYRVGRRSRIQDEGLVEPPPRGGEGATPGNPASQRACVTEKDRAEPGNGKLVRDRVS